MRRAQACNHSCLTLAGVGGGGGWGSEPSVVLALPPSGGRVGVPVKAEQKQRRA